MLNLYVAFLQVKFISENGDAKIDIGVINQESAMGKEELMKFVNDPFWVKMRWALFIGFWLLWAAMLAGAIAIIVMAPKCSVPEPKKLWEESSIVQLDASDSPSNNLIGLKPILKELKDLNVKAISISSLVKESLNGMYKLKNKIYLIHITSHKKSYFYLNFLINYILIPRVFLEQDT